MPAFEVRLSYCLLAKFLEEERWAFIDSLPFCAYESVVDYNAHNKIIAVIFEISFLYLFLSFYFIQEKNVL